MLKNAQLSVRVTENEMSRLRAMAAQDEIRLSDLVRRCLISASTQQPSPPQGLFQRIAGGIVSAR
jgi:hypothetical protein